MTRRPPFRRAPPISADDHALWHTVTHDVAPLRSPSENVPPVAEEAAEENAPPARLSKNTVLTPAVPPPSPPRRAPNAPPLEVGKTDGVDRATADRFRRGAMPIEARLDLHGLTQADAHAALHRFIDRCCAEEKRCVLVITGKGTSRRHGAGDDDMRGVLRRQTPQWLSDPVVRGRILSVVPAQPKDGGAGALYVLLKRRRSSS